MFNLSKYVNNKLSCGDLNTISPSKGDIHVCKDQIYIFNRDDDNYLVWDTHCAECGIAFEAKVRPNMRAINRRCPLHAKAGTRIQNVHPAAQGKSKGGVSKKAPAPAGVSPLSAFAATDEAKELYQKWKVSGSIRPWQEYAQDYLDNQLD